MKKDIFAFTFFTLLGITAIVYGITQFGNPFEQQKRKVDHIRVSNLGRISERINFYYQRNVKLPSGLSELSSDPTYSYNPLAITDPETKLPYLYEASHDNTYKLCATFATETEKESVSDSQNYEYSRFQTRFKHPKGYYCFPLNVQATTPFYPLQNFTPTPTTSQQTFADPNIASVTSTARNIVFSNFPTGFFTEKDEHGLINYENRPITVTISFKKPVKLKSIANTFTHCAVPNCYSWNATGNAASTVTLVKQIITNVDVESKAIISSDNEFTFVQLTAQNISGGDGYVHWEKITFEYK